MNSRTAYIGQQVHPDALELLRAHGDVVLGYGPSAMSIEDAMPEMDALMLHWQTIDATFFERAPRLKVIARHGVGVDNVDLVEAEARGIPVLIAAEANYRSVAEQAITLMMAVRRQVARGHLLVSGGGFAERDETYLGEELFGSTLGVIGFGRIGRHVAHVARALGMRVRAFDPFLTADEIEQRGAEPSANLAELLPDCDVLTINIPLSESTHHLLGAAEFAQMKPGSVLIHTARGGIVDEGALVEALQTGHLAGAGLDVFEQEPPSPENPLLSMSQVVLSPHVGAYTRTGERLMGLYAAQAIVDHWNGVDPDATGRPWGRAPRP
ncbi:hydroxyacid dehydrogenase [Mycobacterium sp. SMC-4]|uniref:hydroxyacid dehydrogenase n=1 Tax=Mycobacterium sp. SMC-4 TaxID=2857059 RepID=UPI003CFF30BA